MERVTRGPCPHPQGAREEEGSAGAQRGAGEDAHYARAVGRLGHLRRSWSARGEVGAFASTRWRDFHTRLVASAFPVGGVQLARVSAGDQVIGLLYNLVERGRVAFYQSGFRYEDDNRLKPGQLTHALVVQACLEQGHDVYDFLAGGPEGERYKASLATDTSRLAWCVVRRPTLRNRVASGLRTAKRLLRATP